MLGKFDLHNPGNIKQNADLFIGEIKPSSHPLFKEFASNIFGYRAMFKILETYRKKGFITIASIITRYAPPSSNDTVSYINDVAAKTGTDAGAVLNFDKQTLTKLVAAMTWHENGIPGDENEINRGYDLYAGINEIKKGIPVGLVTALLLTLYLIQKDKP